MLEKGLENDKEELEERQQDREFIMKFVRQVNPSKIQPSQKKKTLQTDRANPRESFQFDNEDQQEGSNSILNHLKGSNVFRGQSGIMTPKINGIKKKAKNQVKD